jgi:hypothetical protein
LGKDNGPKPLALAQFFEPKHFAPETQQSEEKPRQEQNEASDQESLEPMMLESVENYSATKRDQ